MKMTRIGAMPMSGLPLRVSFGRDVRRFGIRRLESGFDQPHQPRLDQGRNARGRELLPVHDALCDLPRSLALGASFARHFHSPLQEALVVGDAHPATRTDAGPLPPHLTHTPLHSRQFSSR